ncbi:MAG: hypothetical protein NVS3B21_29950 [Acidimicrobiales bacterium]
MKVLLHFTPLGTPLGLWWLDEESGQPDCYYPSVSMAEIRARATLREKVDDVTWERFFDLLATRHPYIDWWETTEVAAVSELTAHPSDPTRARSYPRGRHRDRRTPQRHQLMGRG